MMKTKRKTKKKTFALEPQKRCKQHGKAVLVNAAPTPAPKKRNPVPTFSDPKRNRMYAPSFHVAIQQPTKIKADGKTPKDQNSIGILSRLRGGSNRDLLGLYAIGAAEDLASNLGAVNDSSGDCESSRLHQVLVNLASTLTTLIDTPMVYHQHELNGTQY